MVHNGLQDESHKKKIHLTLMSVNEECVLQHILLNCIEEAGAEKRGEACLGVWTMESLGRLALRVGVAGRALGLPAAGLGL